MNANDVLQALRQRHPPNKWAFLTEVRTRTGYSAFREHGSEVGERYIDAFAMSLWPSDGFKRLAYEVKVSRSDFVRELHEPVKRFQARVLSHEFWYVLIPGLYSHKTDYPLLDGCGVLEVYEGGSKILVRPSKGHIPHPMPEHFVASLLRNAVSSNNAHADSVIQVVKQAQFLRNSGYDGPFMGDAVAPLFDALARMELIMGDIPHPEIYPKAQVTYVVGDATLPIHRPAVIIHACNDVGAWGKGFVMALSAKWPGPEQAYRASKAELGTCSAARVADDVFVINMVCQRGISDDRCISMEALSKCLAVVDEVVEKLPGAPTIHCPRIGTGLGQTAWSTTEMVMVYALPHKHVYVYDLPR